jgi:uncharacterized protein with HEPN domain
MSIEEKKYLFDILQSSETIAEYVPHGTKFAEFKANKMMQDAVIRRLEIIGEATSKLLKLNPEILITDNRKIKALRNIIAHEYDRITIEDIWVIIERSLPTLKAEVEKLLNQ